ncbi:hypothetical protein D7Y27_16690 [Corallococcus sp. AB004]|uniref:immunity protein TriTu family protein n=1 Tax=Corallococcus exiguus TaxID=83462 RepID=UPI000EA1AC46|nr:hypothetical protein [Corallococcus exiguus]NPD25808.1 hypothetical protein [Corallococcus exiguus]RKI42535.1 hypothetical protein D7Y27_16690 [Corallococcus sp. AB004]
MRTGILEAFHRWFSECGARLASPGVSIEFREVTNGDPRSARIDLESDSKLGRATVWETGLCDLELLDVETQEPLLYRHHEQLTPARLAAVLDEFAGHFGHPA